jgi:phosphoglycolate phosphatase
MLLHVIYKSGCLPERTLYIGDTEADMEMAQRANVQRIAVTYGLGEESRLISYKPKWVIHSISELLGLV